MFSHRMGGRRALPPLLLSFALTAALAGCSLPNSSAAPTAVALPTYAPGAAESSVLATATPAADTDRTAAAPAADETPGAPGEMPVDPAPPPAASSSAGVYSAEVVADKQVVVAAQVNGQVIEVNVDVGDTVKAGDVLVRQDTLMLEAQRAQALASLEAAKSQFELLQDPAKAQDLAAARAAVDAADAAYARATNGPTDEEKRLALAQLKSSEAAITVAQAAYNRVKGDPNIGMMPQSLQLEQATLANEAAQAQYDKLMKGATADQVAGAYAQLENARAALQRLVDGARPAQVDAAEAQMHAAENGLYLAQLQLNKATVTAPMDGMVSKLQTATGALAAPGAPLLTLLSDEVRVNIAVEEKRLPSLAVGQPATIHVEAYPDRIFAGTVAMIAPELDPATRTVQVTIRPTDDDGLLEPGMSATAELLER